MEIEAAQVIPLTVIWFDVAAVLSATPVWSVNVNESGIVSQVGVCPEPLSDMVIGLVVLVALWVIVKVPEAAPCEVGEKRTMTVVAAPGAKLNEPFP